MYTDCRYEQERSLRKVNISLLHAFVRKCRPKKPRTECCMKVQGQTFHGLYVLWVKTFRGELLFLFCLVALQIRALWLVIHFCRMLRSVWYCHGYRVEWWLQIPACFVVLNPRINFYGLQRRPEWMNVRLKATPWRPWLLSFPFILDVREVFISRHQEHQQNMLLIQKLDFNARPYKFLTRFQCIKVRAGAKQRCKKTCALWSCAVDTHYSERLCI